MPTTSPPVQGRAVLSKVLIVLSIVVSIPMGYALLFGVSHGTGSFLMLLVPGGVMAGILALVAATAMVQDAQQRTGITYVAVASGFAAALITILPWFYA